MSIISNYVKQFQVKPEFVKNLGDFAAYTYQMTVSEATEFLNRFHYKIKKDKYEKSRELAFIIVDKDGKKPFSVDNENDLKDLSLLPFSDYKAFMTAFNKLNGFADDNADKKKE